MAHEAFALHEMMGGYQLSDLVQQRATQAAPAAGRRIEQPAPRAARRSTASNRSRAAGSAQVAAATAEDGEWQASKHSVMTRIS